MGTDAKKLDFEMLKNAVSGHAAAIRCKTILQPAAGCGTKVFPPTHAGGVYATEQRRVPDKDKPGETRVVDCVLLDSVQSQANRIEDALQQAIDDGKLSMPLIVVNFGDAVADVQRVTSLQAPHRAADAILRDSLTAQNVPFRKSDIGKAITDSSLANATGLFRYCPHALFLGVWDSTGPKGGLGAKFARALVSEIVGIDWERGNRTGGRLDPTQVRKSAGPLYFKDTAKFGGIEWTLNEAEAIKEKGKPKLFERKGGEGNPGDPIKANHGNYPPNVQEEGGGGTIAHAEHTAVLSLPQLRRLRFPIDGRLDPKVDDAARTVLGALALVGLTLSLERGCDLRSRCLLFPEGPLSFELLETPGKPTPISFNSTQAIAIYNDAVKAAKDLKLPWQTTPITLMPSPELIALVKKSQELAAAGEGEGE